MIDFQHVTKHYEGHTALDQVSFSIKQGSIFGLLGPNGSGKTTLLRLVTRILLPDAGKVFYEGKEMTNAQVRRIGYLPEERGLYPKMRANEHLVFLAALKGMTSRESREKIAYWSQKLELDGLMDRKIEALSKGQQQKIQLIAALIHQPDLIILDEPFSGFDPVNAEVLKSIILELKAQGKTLLISTHRMENAEELCDEVVVLQNGTVVLSGELEDLLQERSIPSYRVITSSPIAPHEAYTIVQEKGTRYLLLAKQSGNDLLSSLSSQTQVISFTPERKTLKDVFLEKVKINYVN